MYLIDRGVHSLPCEPNYTHALAFEHSFLCVFRIDRTHDEETTAVVILTLKAIVIAIARGIRDAVAGVVVVAVDVVAVEAVADVVVVAVVRAVPRDSTLCAAPPHKTRTRVVEEEANKTRRATYVFVFCCSLSGLNIALLLSKIVSCWPFAVFACVN